MLYHATGEILQAFSGGRQSALNSFARKRISRAAHDSVQPWSLAQLIAWKAALARWGSGFSGFVSEADGDVKPAKLSGRKAEAHSS
mgnify:CR=1